MKKYVIMLMLTAITAMFYNGATAQVTMVNTVSDLGFTPSSQTRDTVVASGTGYFITPANSINSATSGKFRVSVGYTPYNGAWTGKIIIQGRLSQGNTTDSSWVNLNNVRGTDGVNCDTLQVTSASTGGGWIFNAMPGTAHVEATGLTTAIQNVYWSGAGRVVQIRVKIVGTTNSVIVHDVKCLVAN